MSIATAYSIPRRMANFGQDLQMPVVAAIAYYLGAEAAFFVGTLSDKIFAPFWPPNIVLLCALLLAPYRQWWLFILAAFPAHVLAELGVGMSAPTLLVAFATNCLVALGSAAALKELFEDPPWFRSLRNACLYILIATIAAPMAVALGGAFVPIMSGGSSENYWAYWAQWYMSNALGSLTLGPVALIWLSERYAPWRFSIARAIEAALVSVALVAVCAFAFQLSAAHTVGSFLPALLYAPLPFVLWAAIRFGAQGAGSAILIVAVVLVWRTLNGPSLFIAANAETSVFAMQSFLLGLSIPILLLGAAIDEARSAEQQVRESEERMTFAAVSANVCLWRFDYDTDRFWITDHGRGMLGFGPRESITRTAMINAVHPEDRESARDTIRAAIADRRLAECEFRIVRPDGQMHWFRCRARAHANHRGEPAQISGTFTDITEQKANEIELAQQRQELTHLTRVSMLGELSGGIAHELTQPLSAILSNAEAARILIAQDPPNLGEVTEALDDIIGEDNRAGEVIHRLRGLLKKREVKFEPVDVSDIVKSTIRLLHNELISRRVRVTLNLAPDIPLVSGDPVQLQQVLLNLLLNAMDAMNETVPSRRIIIIGTQAGRGELAVNVSDHGVGLTQPHQEGAFRPFFTTKERGLGLGLSLSSTIIKLHGGVLSLDNNANGGATASFRLPHLNVAAAAQ